MRAFAATFILAARSLSKRTGLSISIPALSKEVPDALFAAHAAWQQEMALWLRDLLPGTTEELSHLKKSAILLAKLCEFGCIVVSGNGHRNDGPGRRSLSSGDHLVPPPTRLKAKEIRKFKDGGCAYIGWLICYHLCEFFERHRDDKTDPFESRVTEEFEVDMVSGLLSAKVSAQSVHLVLKALFIRD
ncbi:hypothetical protein ACVWW7_000842 [Bradyrhizobium sp. LM6.9]